MPYSYILRCKCQFFGQLASASSKLTQGYHGHIVCFVPGSTNPMDDLLYQKHFGLSQPPFNITPDPSFLYRSATHREGLAQLSYGVRARKGFVVLTGEVGTGKTTLIHALLNDLNGSAHTALIFSTIVSPTDLLRRVCEEFGLIEPRRGLQGIHDYLV